MKTWLPWAGFSVFMTCFFLTNGYGDEPAVRQTLESYVKTFNDHDAESVIGYWLEDAVHHDRETGERTVGRDAIAEDLRNAFDESLRSQLSGTVERVHFITPDVAKVDGETVFSQVDAEPSRSAFSAILVRRDGKWKFSTIEESPKPIPSGGYEALQPLAALIGRWRDQGQQQTVETEIDWSPGGNFLIRSYGISEEGVETGQGTQIIGWDPREQQIRSWSFNSDGSFGDGVWSSSGDHWLVRSSQTLADGRAASGTYVIATNGSDSVRLRLIGHEIEGEPQPSPDAVVMNRIKETPDDDSVSTNAESSSAVANSSETNQ